MNPIIFAIDVPDLNQALRWARLLRGEVGWFKVGLELWSACGRDAVGAVASEAGETGIFLDLKLHDIPATVHRTVDVLRESGARMLTVHAQGGKSMLEAAVVAAGSAIQIIAVTRLTSLDAPIEAVAEAARQARESGCGGVVCSGREAAVVRDAVGPSMRVICPGVRPAGTDPGDQRRVVTPREAIRAGADYIVVGRPIRDHGDPVAAARAIREECGLA